MRGHVFTALIIIALVGIYVYIQTREVTSVPVVKRIAGPLPDPSTDDTFYKTAKRIGADKVTGHFFESLYSRYLDAYRHLPLKVLEIGLGCYNLYSVPLWRQYLPNATIYWLDYSKTRNFCLSNAKKLLNPSDGAYMKKNAFFGDQGSNTSLHELIRRTGGDGFDIIIDDGSHNIPHQLFTFQILFSKALRPGGVYVIEDLNCNYHTKWGATRELQRRGFTCVEAVKDVATRCLLPSLLSPETGPRTCHNVRFSDWNEHAGEVVEMVHVREASAMVKRSEAHSSLPLALFRGAPPQFAYHPTDIIDGANAPLSSSCLAAFLKQQTSNPSFPHRGAVVDATLCDFVRKSTSNSESVRTVVSNVFGKMLAAMDTPRVPAGGYYVLLLPKRRSDLWTQLLVEALDAYLRDVVEALHFHDRDIIFTWEPRGRVPPVYSVPSFAQGVRNHIDLVEMRGNNLVFRTKTAR